MNDNIENWKRNLIEAEDKIDVIELIQEKIHKSRFELRSSNFDESRRIYTEIIRLYNGLDQDNKSKVYQKINDLYYERKDTERLEAKYEASHEAHEARKFDKRKTVYYAVPVILLLLIMGVLFVSKPGITGYVVVSKESNFSQDLGLVVNESSEYMWLLENKGSLKDIRVSGRVTESSKAKIYVKKDGRLRLIYDSEVSKDANKITGFVVSGGIIESNETIKINVNETNDGNKINGANDTSNISSADPEDVKTIAISLEYEADSSYDIENDGIEQITEVIDFTVRETQFNWDIDYSNLCARWDTYSVDNKESTIVCYGASRCCNFIDLEPIRALWNETFYSYYGLDGATFNNIISSQLIYVDYNLSVDEPYAEVYYSDWQNLSAKYYQEIIKLDEFKDICVETCVLAGFNKDNYSLVFGIYNGTLYLDEISYTVTEKVEKVKINIEVEDNKGDVSGNYSLYKDNVLVEEEFIEPDYYDIEIIPSENIINKVIIYNTNVTKPLTAIIGIDNVSREQEIKDLEVKKRYAVDVSELEFDTASLTAVSEANSLFKCRQWDYSTEVCYGTWEKVKNLVAGEEYELTITKEDRGFVEGNLNATLAPINITELTLIKNISNITIIKNSNYTINLSDYFLNVDNETIFSYFEIDNVSIEFRSYSAKLIPDKDFIGTGFTYITANKTGNTAISNVFKVAVANVTVNITPKIILEKKDFKFDEDVELDFEYLEKEALVMEGKWKDEYEVYEKETARTKAELELLREKIKAEEELLSEVSKAIKKQKKKFIKENETIETFVRDYKDDLVDIDVEIEELREGRFDIKIPKQRAFRAGKYTIKLELIKDGITYTQEQDFTWGVLAINVNKSIYLPNEDSFIGIAVLDDQGRMVCDADVTLEIISPLNQKTTLTTADGDIIISPECNFLGYTEKPDYYTNYSVSGAGSYIMNLTAKTVDGIRSIQDNFSVQSSVDFDVARKGATRIYPVLPYSMNFTINANQNYNGLINEYVPASFEITPQAGLTVTAINSTKILSWNMNLAAEETYNINYEFDAPDVSPQFYLLGALEIGSFAEARQWQIASDVSAFYDPSGNVAQNWGDGTGTDYLQIDDGVREPNTDSITTDNVADSTQGAATSPSEFSFPSITETPDSISLWVYTDTGGSCSYSFDLQQDGTQRCTTSVAGGTAASWQFCNWTTPSGSFTGMTIELSTVSKGAGPHSSCTVHAAYMEVIPAPADTTPPGVNITNVNETNGQDIRINDVLNITCQSFDSPTVGNITFNLTGSLDLYNFSFELTGTSANFSQNITMNLTRGNVVNVTCWAYDSSSNGAQNSTLITVANRLPTAATIVNTTNLYFNANQTFNVTPLTDDDNDVLTYFWFLNSSTDSYPNLVASGVDVTNWTTNLSGSNAYYLLVNVSDGVGNASGTLFNFTFDATTPTVNTTLNKSSASIVFGDIINITANVTDDFRLELCQIIINQSGFKEIDNVTLSGTNAQCSNKSQVKVYGRSVINYTIRVNDSTGNFRTNDTIITVVDDIMPVVNTTFNKSLTNIITGDVINISANITDEVELSFCQFIHNQSGFVNITNVSLSGTNAQCSNATLITVGTGSVINFTIRANDTSNNFYTNDTVVTIASAANPPVIKLNNASFSVDPVSGDSVKILISFNVSDPDGVTTINASKAIVNLTLGTPGSSQFRTNISDQGGEFGTCGNHTEPGPGAEDARVIINCTVVMKYFDNTSSSWLINISVEDTDGNVERNDTVTFTYNELSSIVLPVSYINFTSLTLGSQNQPAGGAQAILNNTGNDDFDVINITGAAYIGVDTASETIAASSFFVNFTNAVDGDGLALSTSAQTIPGVDDTANLTLQHGHTSALTDYNDDITSSKGNQSLYFWLDVPSSGLSSQKYNNTWNITVIDLT